MSLIIERTKRGSISAVNERGGVLLIMKSPTHDYWDLSVQPDTGYKIIMRLTEDEWRQLIAAITEGQETT